MQFNLTNTDGKIELLLEERGINLLDVKRILDAGEWLAVFKHPKNLSQDLYVIKVNNYCWLVPVVGENLLIKTAFPSRKMTKKYLGV